MDLYSLADDLRGWLLRTDCGGKRPSGQFKPIEGTNAGNMNKLHGNIYLFSIFSVLMVYFTS